MKYSHYYVGLKLVKIISMSLMVMDFGLDGVG